MEITVRETIKKTILKHLKKKNGLILGQCLSAVGWVGGTIPELTEKEGVSDVNATKIEMEIKNMKREHLILKILLIVSIIIIVIILKKLFIK